MQKKRKGDKIEKNISRKFKGFMYRYPTLKQ